MCECVRLYVWVYATLVKVFHRFFPFIFFPHFSNWIHFKLSNLLCSFCFRAFFKIPKMFFFFDSMGTYLHSNYVFRWMDFPNHFYAKYLFLFFFWSEIAIAVAATVIRLDAILHLNFIFYEPFKCWNVCMVHSTFMNIFKWNEGKINIEIKIQERKKNWVNSHQ